MTVTTAASTASETTIAMDWLPDILVAIGFPSVYKSASICFVARFWVTWCVGMNRAKITQQGMQNGRFKGLQAFWKTDVYTV
jgi:hypothetical protein